MPPLRKSVPRASRFIGLNALLHNRSHLRNVLIERGSTDVRRRSPACSPAARCDGRWRRRLRAAVRRWCSRVVARGGVVPRVSWKRRVGRSLRVVWPRGQVRDDRYLTPSSPSTGGQGCVIVELGDGQPIPMHGCCLLEARRDAITLGPCHSAQKSGQQT